MDILSASLNDTTTGKESKKGTIRIVLADDHPIVRDGLKKLLQLEDDFEVVGEAGDGREVLERAIWNVPSESGVVWNINLPSVPAGAPEPEIVFCQHNTSPLPVSFQRDETGAFVYSGHYHTRCRPAEGDVSACFGGAIAISKIPL